MHRRNVLLKLVTFGTLGFMTAGCTSSEVDEPGVVLDSIQFINIDETAREFTVTLRDANEDAVFNDSFRVQGAPGNEYGGREVDDLPSVAASVIEASVLDDSILNEIPDNRDPMIPSIMYHPDQGTGIAWWESGEEDS